MIKHLVMIVDSQLSLPILDTLQKKMLVNVDIPINTKRLMD